MADEHLTVVLHISDHPSEEVPVPQRTLGEVSENSQIPVLRLHAVRLRGSSRRGESDV